MRWQYVHKGSKKTERFFTLRLVVSERTAKGPRHRIILQLGPLDLPKEQHKALADRIEAIVNGENNLFESVVDEKVEALARHYANLLINKKISEGGEEIPAQDQQGEKAGERDLQTVDVNSIRTSTVKQIGAETISLHGFGELGLWEILREAGFNEKERALAAVAIVGRMVHPGSDLNTVQWAKYISGIDELTGQDFRRLGKNALYGISEKLYEKKGEIDRALQQREGTLFSLDRKIILYDLTNTFFEGSGRKSELAMYGRSKEKRTDCPLVTLGFVIDGQGFPLASRVFRGNQSEPETLKEMLSVLQVDLPGADEAQNKPVVIMDAGIASEDNLNLIRENGYNYLVVSRKRYAQIIHLN